MRPIYVARDIHAESKTIEPLPAASLTVYMRAERRFSFVRLIPGRRGTFANKVASGILYTGRTEIGAAFSTIANDCGE